MLLTFGGLGWVTWEVTGRYMYALVDEDLAFRCQALSEEVEVQEGVPRLPEEHTAYAGPTDGFLVLDTAGRTLVERGLADLGPLTGSTGWVGPWRWASQTVLREGKPVARVVVAHDPREAREVLRRLGITLAAWLPGVVLAGVLGGWWLAGRGLAPVRRLARQAHAIGEDRLDQRLPLSRDELGALAEAFNSVLERLEGAFERQKRFTADAAHELRTPLSVIRAICSQPRKPETLERALERIDLTSQRMTRLLDSLLFLAQSDAREPGLELEEVDLVPLLLEQDGVCYQGPSELFLRVDPLRLSQLLGNLVDNARRHSGQEVVELHLRESGERVVLEVVDQGEGIAPEHLPHVMERFYRVDPARSRESGGAGLGLAICASIARAHGGRLSLESTPGVGTTARLELPRRVVETD